MSPPIVRGAAATAVLLCLSACFLKGEKEEEQEEACTFRRVSSPLASGQEPGRKDQPRGEDVRLVWVDAAGQVLGEYVAIVDTSIYIDRHGQYQYSWLTSFQGPFVDGEGRKWKVSFDAIRPYPITPYFESSDCSGPGFLHENFHVGEGEVRGFELEGTVVEPTAGRVSYVPPPGPTGRTCTTMITRSFLDSDGRCVNKSSHLDSSKSVCGYALNALPEFPYPPRKCVPATPLHLEARALPENERKPCDNSHPQGHSSPCWTSRPGVEYLVGVSGPFLDEFYVDDSHYVWRYPIRDRVLGAMVDSSWYYFTDSACQGTRYIDTPPDAHQTLGLRGQGMFARPPDWVPTSSEPLEARSRAAIRGGDTMGPCELMEPTPLGTLLPFSELVRVSVPTIPRYP